MPKTFLKDAEAAAMVVLAMVVVAAATFLTANHILPADVSELADGSVVTALIGVIFHSLGLKSVPMSSLENVVNQIGALAQQAQPAAAQPSPLMIAPAQPSTAPTAQPAPAASALVPAPVQNESAG